MKFVSQIERMENETGLVENETIRSSEKKSE